MDINFPTPVNSTRSTGSEITTSEPVDYSQTEINKQMRKDMIDIARLPYNQLEMYNEMNLGGLPSYKVMWIRVLQKATGPKPDLRSAEFVQEHLAGKAIQRVESQTVALTYQDLLSKVRAAEQKYQTVVAEIIDVTPKVINWNDLV